MANSIDKNQVINYLPEALKGFRVVMYEWVDNLQFIQAPSDYVIEDKPYLEIVKQRFLEAGWHGDGEIGLIWVPPFMFQGVRTPVFTKGVLVWHVKQKEDGISWLLSPVILPCENEV